MSRSRSLFTSPACQRRLQRCIEGGMGLALRQAPLANSKKSPQGLAERSMSDSSTPCCCAGGGTFGPLEPAQAERTTARSGARQVFVMSAAVRLARSKISSDATHPLVYRASMDLVLGAGTAGTPLGNLLQLWSVIPFAAMLGCIAVLPIVAGHFWENNRNKAILSLLLGLPVAVWTASLDKAALAHTAGEYFAFVILLGTLFVIASGIVVRGTLAGTPGLNTAVLATGAVLASIIGTTGASILLVRPLLRANS